MKLKLYLLATLSLSSINAAEADDPTAVLTNLCQKYNNGAKAGKANSTLEEALLILAKESNALARQARTRRGSLSSLGGKVERRKSIELERDGESPLELLQQAGIDVPSCKGLVERKTFSYKVTSHFELFTDNKGNKHYSKEIQHKNFVGFQLVRTKK